MKPISAPNIRRTKYYVMFTIGLLLMIASRCFNSPSLETHTMGGVIGSYAAIPLFYLCINSIIAIAVAAIRRSIKTHFLPILSWLFLVYGFIYFANSAWSAHSTWKTRRDNSNHNTHLTFEDTGMPKEQPSNIYTRRSHDTESVEHSASTLNAFNKGAERGDAEAQFQLGLCYSFGEGVKQDKRKAFELYSKAAEQGHAIAQFNLGTMLLNGQDVAQDLNAAFMWFRKAAEQGDADAQYNLGSMLIRGQGETQDLQAAFDWNMKAARQGNVSAQYRIGVMYEEGLGVKQDRQTAVFWYKKAAEQGDSNAQSNLGALYANGQGVKQDMRVAYGWFMKAAQQGNPIAQRNIGNMYANGDGIKQNERKAFEWYRKAAEQGEMQAHIHLGTMYANGKGVAQNDIQACMHMLIAGELDDKKTQVIEYFKAEGLPKDVFDSAQREADKWIALFRTREPVE